MPTWSTGPLLGFDTETTGVDVRHDRIVTAALVMRDSGGSRQRTWLIDPGVEIPEAASAIHGITTARARSEGRPPAAALDELAAEIVHAQRAGVPVVAYNASFDFAILDHELARWQLPTLAERLGRDVGPVLDPLVIDRAVDRYRRGKRTLSALCEHYQVVTTAELHTAEVDVLATMQVLDCLVTVYPEVGEMPLVALAGWQRDRHRDWAENFNEWRVRQGFEGPGAELVWLPRHEPVVVS
ncbi:exonuclease domain-containing protein [Georgenia sp. MJ173]|uniref:exonuclease domain-containing protein n=1 Tax=Georgenia sunbinii TaxID=3117728 RepID=UPI002F26AE08